MTYPAIHDRRRAPIALAPDPAPAEWPIRLLRSKILRGCNVYHAGTVIRQEVDFGGLRGVYSGRAGRDFPGRFLDRFFRLRQTVPESAMSDGFVERLSSPRGAPFEEVLLEAILAVDTSMNFAMRQLEAIRFAEIVPRSSSRTAYLVWQSNVPKISRAAARVGLAGLLELLPETLRSPEGDAAEDFASAFARLEKRANKRTRSTTTAVLALAANRRGLPFESLGGPYLRVGQGALQRVIYASATGHTSLAASQLSRNKRKTNRRLAELRLPVPRQIKVSTAEEAVAAAETVGYPLVIKPLKEKQALGVSAGIMRAEEIRPAFARAYRPGSAVILESFVQGQVYRLLVIDHRFVAALETVPPTVTGDGKSTIAELVGALNDDPLRNGLRLYPVAVDDDLRHVLAKSGLALDDVLGQGQTVALRATANVANGGIHTDVTDSVHPDNRELAVWATQAVGLDVAGIDFITSDISRSHKDVGGSIIEVNARPGLCMHTWPRYGEFRNVAGAALELSFPPGVTGRIPTALVVGDRGTEPVAHDVDQLLRACGKVQGLVIRKRAFIDGRALELEAARARHAVRAVVRDPRVETLVNAVSFRQVVTRGLVLDGCDAAAIMAAGSEDERLVQRGLEVVVKATRGVLVARAEDKLALEAINALDPQRLVLLSPSLEDPAVVEHVAAGGAVVSTVNKPDRAAILLYRKDRVIASVPVEMNGAARLMRSRSVESRMFALALAHAIGLSGADIEAAAKAGTSVAAAR